MSSPIQEIRYLWTSWELNLLVMDPLAMLVKMHKTKWIKAQISYLSFKALLLKELASLIMVDQEETVMLEMPCKENPWQELSINLKLGRPLMKIIL